MVNGKWLMIRSGLPLGSAKNVECKALGPEPQSLNLPRLAHRPMERSVRRRCLADLLHRRCR